MEKLIIEGNFSQDDKVLIMIHGRGARAENIISLAAELNLKNTTLMAPQAKGNTWYPYSFLAPTAENEPALTHSLMQIDNCVERALQNNIAHEKIFFLGFSQGACLALEYAARNARKWGGVIAFTGGLIGEKLNAETYSGSFDGTPVYIGSSDKDAHVPLQRVHETKEMLEKMEAFVTLDIFPNMGHTINQQEINAASKILNR